MAKTPEQSFYLWIQNNFDWFFQRIETTTANGVPDLWTCSQGHSMWIETKACNATNVQIRKSQFAWCCKAHWNGWPVWIWNRSPRRKTVIQAWRTPFDTISGKQDHLKIVSEPLIALPSESFSKMTIKQFVLYR